MRIDFSTRWLSRCLALGLALGTAGCHLLPGSAREGEQTVFPDLRNVPSPPESAVTPAEQGALIRELESEREGVPLPASPGEGPPAVPPRDKTSALDAAIAATRSGSVGVAQKNRIAPPPAPAWQRLGEVFAPPAGEGARAILAAASIPEMGEPVAAFPLLRGTLRSEAAAPSGVTAAMPTPAPSLASLVVSFHPGTDKLAGEVQRDLQLLAAALSARPSARLEVYAAGPNDQALPLASDRLGAFSTGLKRATAVTSALIEAGAPADRVVLVTGHDSTRFTQLEPHERAALGESAIVRFAERER